MTSQDFLDDLWGSSEEEAPIKSSSYNSNTLAKYFKDMLTQQYWYNGFGIVNLRALSGQFARWKKTGLTAEQAYAMVDLYLERESLRGQFPGWEDFVKNRDKILQAVQPEKLDEPAPDVTEYDEEAEMAAYLARRNNR